MFTDELNEFLDEAGRFPAHLWAHRYFLARKSFLAQAKAVTIKEGTSAQRALDSFVQILTQEDLDEFALAMAFSELANVLTRSQVKDTALSLFAERASAFLQRAKTFDRYRKRREQLQATLSIQDRVEADQRLFRGEGMMYVLEFYLAVYKALTDLPHDEDRKKFILADQIDLGFGKGPGIRADLARDESLEKFIFLIFDDKLRERLEGYYFRYKAGMVYMEDVGKATTALREFVVALLEAFQDQGVTHLTGTLLTPYGRQPTIASLLKKLRLI